MKKSAMIISSFLAILLSVALIVGSTLSLFTQETPVNISISSGAIKLNAEIKGFTLFSAKPDPEGELVDENGATYSYEDLGDSNRFTNGGKGYIYPDGTLAFENISAGDKVEFDIELENKSDFKIRYNTKLTLLNQVTNDLFNELNVTVTQKQTGAAVTAYSSDSNALSTSWLPLAKKGAEGNKAVVRVTIGLPVTAKNSVQNLTATVKCSVSAVQANSDKWGVAVLNGESFGTVADAVNVAKNGDTIEIVRGDYGDMTGFYNGAIEIDKEIRIQSADGERYAFNDMPFKVIGGGSLTVKDLKFTGNSYIDASGASSVTMDNCEVELAPTKLFDELNRTSLERAAYVAANGNEQSGMRLEITNNTFLLTDGSEHNTAAVYLETALSDGSVISGNTFGTEHNSFAGSAVDLRSITAGATVKVENNTFYGVKALSFSQKYTLNSFSVRLTENNMHSFETEIFLAEVKGGIALDITDSGSKVNGVKITLDDFDCAGNTLFYGIDVTYGRDGRITGGTIKIISSVLAANANSEFITRYVSSAAYIEDLIFV